MTQGNQPAVGLVVKLPFATPEEFLSRYGSNLTRGGIYLRAKSVKPPGSRVVLDLKLQGGERLLYVSAVVHFVTGQEGTGVPGMGLRFVTVEEETQKFLDEKVALLPHARSNLPPLPPQVGPALYGPPEPAVLPFAEGEPARVGPVVGIDLGTTNSCVAVVDPQTRQPRVLFAEGTPHTTPSMVATNAKGKLLVGHPAKAQLLTNPKQTVTAAKRLLGQAADSAVSQQVKERFAYEVLASEEGEAAFKLGEQLFTVQQVSALVLRELKEQAQAQLGVSVSRVVITVPAYYSDRQRQAVREAARLAGLYVERILNEPTAAALAYGHGKQLKQRILVYDLGGGTFDASLLELSGNVYEVVSTGGNTFLGGMDFDAAVVGHLLFAFEAKYGRPLGADRVALQRLTDAAERAKCALSERRQTKIQIPYLTAIDGKPCDLEVALTREELVELTESLVDRTLEVCREVLAAKGLSPKEVDEVVLVGGQSRFPLVHDKVQAFFGKPAMKSVHPDESVAVGAAIYASSVGQVDAVTLLDVLPMTVGVGLPGNRFKPVLAKNSPLPAKRQYVIGTTKDDQTEVELLVFQGESEQATENDYLGTLKLVGIEPKPRGDCKVEVTFEVSAEAVLTAVAKDLQSGNEVRANFSTQRVQQAVKALQSLPAAASPAPTVRTLEQIPIVAPEAVEAGKASGGMSGFFKKLWKRDT